ncbi:MAG: hypothetical protein ACKOKH_10315, partial [Bacteroidota bacterium]
MGAHPPWSWNAFDPTQNHGAQLRGGATQIAEKAVSLRLLNRWIFLEDASETHPGRVAEWLGR